MTRVLRYFLFFAAFWMSVSVAMAQTSESEIRGLHKVKKKETIFGISRLYDITIEQLMKANPEMNNPGYELKKGAVLRIPYPKQKTVAPAAKPVDEKETDDLRKRTIRLGVMLPLHNVNGDGKRMVEYYRGVLMACDSIKKLGVSVDVHAWNAAEDGDINKILKDEAAAKCDLIIGPLYSKQMDAMSAFVQKHKIKLLIPFSITAPQLADNKYIYQVYQSNTQLNSATIEHFVKAFKNYHTVIIDCNDSTSQKGSFTTALRRQLDQENMGCNITNLKSGEADFSKAFSRTKPNVVILNTGRSPELGIAFSKLNGLKVTNPDLVINMFGYTEWPMYTRTHLENFYKFNTYVPSVFYYNPLASSTKRLQQKFRWNFHTDMQNSLPRFAITGFDHAFYFLMGLHREGRKFIGEKTNPDYVQTPLQFERYGNGGLRNHTQLFVHYTPDSRVETIKF
jgi:ABC-type branched-subunit amino acid transport system substrate-binding protein